MPLIMQAVSTQVCELVVLLVVIREPPSLQAPQGGLNEAVILAAAL